MSFAPEVISDSSGKFFGNALRFQTSDEAEAWVADLKRRWLLVRETRVVESDEAATDTYVDGVLTRICEEVN